MRNCNCDISCTSAEGVQSPGFSVKDNILAEGVVYTSSVFSNQWVIVKICVLYLCNSQRTGATKEKLSHRHRQEEAGGRVCSEYLLSHADTQLLVVYVCGMSLIIVSGFHSPHFI